MRGTQICPVVEVSCARKLDETRDVRAIFDGAKLHPNPPRRSRDVVHFMSVPVSESGAGLMTCAVNRSPGTDRAADSP